MDKQIQLTKQNTTKQCLIKAAAEEEEKGGGGGGGGERESCLLYTSPSPRDVHKSRMPSSA